MMTAEDKAPPVDPGSEYQCYNDDKYDRMAKFVLWCPLSPVTVFFRLTVYSRRYVISRLTIRTSFRRFGKCW